MSRRNFILQAGSASLTLPVLSSLLSEKALAAGIRPPKRFIAVSHRYGHHLPYFFPSAAANIKINDHTFYRKLSDIPGPMSVVFNEKFDPYRSRMNIYQGLDSIGGGGHNSTVPLTGGSFDGSESEESPPKFGKSIDVLMAKSRSLYEDIKRFEAIRIANGPIGVSWDRDSKGVAIAVPNLVGDQNVFNALFAGSAGGSGQAANQKQKLIIDQVFERYLTIRKNPRMSKSDQSRFEQHVAQVTDLQKRLQVQLGTCQIPKLAAFVQGTTGVETLWKNQVDSLVSALACDLTRVGVLHVSDYQPGPNQNYSEAHGISHSREGEAPAALISKEHSAFKADQILYLLQKLSGIQEADGSSLLDHTVVLWTSELSNGNFHVASCLPCATFGSAGGALKTGYLMDFRLKPIQYLAGRADFLAPLGQSYNRLLITLMRAMGLQPSEYLSAGDGGGFGEFSQKITYIDQQYVQFMGQRNDPLPLVFS